METNKPPVDNPGQSFEENLEKYQVYSPLEIGRILRGIQADRQLIRMSFAGTLETMITRVLDVDVKKKILILDSGLVSAQNEIAIKSNLVSFESVLDRINISFSTSKVFLDTYEGSLALRVPFPERLTRLQRREHFRVPVSNSTIRFTLEVDGHVTHSVCNIRDLSPNGACVIDTSMMLDNTVGRIYRNCRLDLPETQPLTVTLEIRNSNEMTMPGTVPQRRIGCRFVDMSSAKSALIQRYITRLERQQKIRIG